jgi:hypothetical protein
MAAMWVMCREEPMSVHRFELFADYFQFYLQDESVDGNLGEKWSPEATDRLLALAHGTIGVGTVRNMTVPVCLEFRDSAPTDDVKCDHAVECSIEIPSGKLVIAGCTDYFPEAARINVKPGTYRARVYYAGLDSLSSDGLDGSDSYHLVLWLAPQGEVVVLKKFSGSRSIASL